VHRLDRPVAGVFLLAKTSKAAARLSAEFRQGRVEKIYRAVVEGTPEPAEATLTDFMVRDAAARRSMLVEPGTQRAREVRLDYRVLASKGKASLVEVSPKTGRSHQIRVQLAGHGHPILGDVKYGATKPLPGGVIALYARELRVRHPTRDETVEIAAGPPPGWPWPVLERRAGEQESRRGGERRTRVSRGPNARGHSTQ
jgi:23S rRNA pseudouridine1911/1915/1917 synthase